MAKCRSCGATVGGSAWKCAQCGSEVATGHMIWGKVALFGVFAVLAIYVFSNVQT